MLWSRYVTAVESHLAVEADRRGLETFRRQYMRNAVLDLQRLIPGMQGPFVSTYTLGDVVADGRAQVLTLPTGAKPKALYIYQVDSPGEDHSDVCCRYRLSHLPWNSRQLMKCGALATSLAAGCSVEAPVVSAAYVWSRSPLGREIVFYPQITPSTRLQLNWQGYYHNLRDSDDVPFPEESSEAVADYVMARIAMVVDKRPDMARMHFDAYRAKRLDLYRDFRELTNDLADDPEDEQSATVITPPSILRAFGATDIQLLGTVTQLEGTTIAALAAVPTVSIAPPLSVIVIIGGNQQMWTLTADTDANNPANGVLRPNDYGVGNQKVWFQGSV